MSKQVYIVPLFGLWFAPDTRSLFTYTPTELNSLLYMSIALQKYYRQFLHLDIYVKVLAPREQVADFPNQSTDGINDLERPFLEAHGLNQLLDTYYHFPRKPWDWPYSLGDALTTISDHKAWSEKEVKEMYSTFFNAYPDSVKPLGMWTLLMINNGWACSHEILHTAGGFSHFSPEGDQLPNSEQIRLEYTPTFELVEVQDPDIRKLNYLFSFQRVKGINT